MREHEHNVETERVAPLTTHALSDDVGCEAILDPLDLVPQHELTLLQPRELKRVAAALLLQREDCAVEGAVFLAEFDEARSQRPLFRRVGDVKAVSVVGDVPSR